MTQPLACLTCTFWRKYPHKNANWGTCQKITPFINGNLAHTETGTLQTQAQFYCAQYERKQQTQTRTVVDAARDAVRSLRKEQ